MDAERNYHGGPWRCFHCDDVFTTVGAASDHFGPHPAATPGCVIDKILPEGGSNTQRGLGLLMALRKAEAELASYRAEDTELHRSMHRQDSEHRQALIREEEKGYRRGLADGHRFPADAAAAAGVAGTDVGIPITPPGVLGWLFANCRIVYHPPGGQYPVEHNPHALGYDKDGTNFLALTAPYRPAGVSVLGGETKGAQTPMDPP